MILRPLVYRDPRQQWPASQVEVSIKNHILYEVPKISVIQSDIRGSRGSIRSTDVPALPPASVWNQDAIVHGQISGTISKMAFKSAGTSVLRIEPRLPRISA